MKNSRAASGDFQIRSACAHPEARRVTTTLWGALRQSCLEASQGRLRDSALFKKTVTRSQFRGDGLLVDESFLHNPAETPFQRRQCLREPKAEAEWQSRLLTAELIESTVYVAGLAALTGRLPSHCRRL